VNGVALEARRERVCSGCGVPLGRLNLYEVIGLRGLCGSCADSEERLEVSLSD
jgi:hypothetical protein